MGTICKGLTPWKATDGMRAGSLCHWTPTPKCPESTINSDRCLSMAHNGFEALTQSPRRQLRPGSPPTLSSQCSGSAGRYIRRKPMPTCPNYRHLFFEAVDCFADLCTHHRFPAGPRPDWAAHILALSALPRGQHANQYGQGLWPPWGLACRGHSLAICRGNQCLRCMAKSWWDRALALLGRSSLGAFLPIESVPGSRKTCIWGLNRKNQ